jgi:hypothetical protein
MTIEDREAFTEKFREYSTTQLLRLYRDIDSVKAPKYVIDECREIVFDILRNEREIEFPIFTSAFVY